MEKDSVRIDGSLNSRGINNNKGLSDEISRHLANSRESEFQNVRSRQQRKLENLAKKQQNVSRNKGNTLFSEQLDISGTQLKRWVKNLSKYKLSVDETKVLARGLGFAVSPENVQSQAVLDEHIVACEKACRRLPNSEAEQLRAEIVGTLKSAKPPPSNISKNERAAIKSLQN